MKEKLTIDQKLLRAVILGNEADVKEMLSQGANPDAKDYEHYPALWLAAEKGYTRIAEMLLDKGADINYENARGSRAIYVAANNGQTETVELLLERGASVEYDFHGFNPLLTAIAHDYTEIVNLLLEYGAQH